MTLDIASLGIKQACLTVQQTNYTLLISAPDTELLNNTKLA